MQYMKKHEHPNSGGFISTTINLLLIFWVITVKGISLLSFFQFTKEDGKSCLIFQL